MNASDKPSEHPPSRKYRNIGKIGRFRKSQLGFGFGLLIHPKTDTQWIIRNLFFCKADFVNGVV